MKEPLIFDIAMGQTKPESIRQRNAHCPFCDTPQLTDILDTSTDGIIWLMNKYPVLKGTWPTVIIETPAHIHTEFSELPLHKGTKILEFSREKWEETKNNPAFQSVLYFKNFGPMSGGSIYHPHSQIIGLYDYDYRRDIQNQHFQGWPIHNEKGMEITLSKYPLIGFFEFNLIIDPTIDSQSLTLRIQQIISYLLKGFSKHSQSYNIFFYDINDGYHYIKIVPRYLTSPLFVGYGIPQVCNEERAIQIIKELHSYLYTP